MGKSFGDLWKLFLRFADEKTPEILTGLGVLGVFQTARMAYKAGPKGKEIMEAKKQDLKDTSPDDHAAKRAVVGEMVKEMTPVVGPPIAMGVATSACILGSHHVSSRRIAAISAAYSITETALKDYQEKTVELLGKKKAQDIREAISKDKVAKNPPSQGSSQIIMTSDGDVLCFDSYSGRYFRSNAQKIGSAINRMNHNLRNEMYISLNDFWIDLGIPTLPMGDEFGWNIDDCINGEIPIHITAILTPEEQPCLCVDYDIHLRRDFRNLH